VIVEPINTADFLEKMSTLLGPLRARMNTLVNLYSKKDLQLILRFMTEAARISREETVRLAEAATLARRFGTSDSMSKDPGGPSPKDPVGSPKRRRATAQSRGGRSSR
jgi:hypothetical protein